MKTTKDDFEKFWASADEDLKRKFAYIGFVRCYSMWARLVESGVLIFFPDKKEEP